MHEDGVAQRPDIPRQAGFNVLAKPEDADGKDVDEVVEAAEDVLHGRRHVTEGPGLAGVHEVGELVYGGKDVRLCRKKGQRSPKAKGSDCSTKKSPKLNHFCCSKSSVSQLKLYIESLKLFRPVIVFVMLVV